MCARCTRWHQAARRCTSCFGGIVVSCTYESSQGALELKTPVHLVVSKASKSAVKAVEKLGGTVFCKYYNDLALRDCVKGRTDRMEAAPTRRNDIGKPREQFVRRCTNSAIVWYTEWRNRGYLSPEALARMPIVHERWQELSQQLRSYKSQAFDKQK